VEIAALALLVGLVIGVLIGRRPRSLPPIAPAVVPAPVVVHEPRQPDLRFTSGEQWEANLHAMVLRHERLDSAFPTDDPTVYRLRENLDGTLAMQLSPESRQTVIHRIEDRLSKAHLAEPGSTEDQARAEIARLQRAEWEPVPATIAEALRRQLDDQRRRRG